MAEGTKLKDPIFTHESIPSLIRAGHLQSHAPGLLVLSFRVWLEPSCIGPDICTSGPTHIGHGLNMYPSFPEYVSLQATCLTDEGTRLRLSIIGTTRTHLLHLNLLISPCSCQVLRSRYLAYFYPCTPRHGLFDRHLISLCRTDPRIRSWSGPLSYRTFPSQPTLPLKFKIDVGYPTLETKTGTCKSDAQSP